MFFSKDSRNLLFMLGINSGRIIKGVITIVTQKNIKQLSLKLLVKTLLTELVLAFSITGMYTSNIL